MARLHRRVSPYDKCFMATSETLGSTRYNRGAA
jgi:hypothetical protein